MPSREAFAKRVFLWAGIYGLVALIPQYFLEARLGRDFPPAITHPEHFYGFLGVAMAWQVAFFAIAKEPLRLRPVMLAAGLEKFAFATSTLMLFYAARVPTLLVGFAMIDLALGALFLASWIRCREVRR